MILNDLHNIFPFLVWTTLYKNHYSKIRTTWILTVIFLRQNCFLKFRILKPADSPTESLAESRAESTADSTIESIDESTADSAIAFQQKVCKNWPLVNLRSACATTGYRTPINSSRSISPSLLESPRVNKASISWTQIRSTAENHVFWHNR